MPLLRWNLSYSVHEPVLDGHHQILFDMMNSVYDKVVNSSDLSCILPVIDGLHEYSSYHFSAEEEFMRGNGYTGIDAHIEKHKEFTRAIEALRTRYHDNDLEVASELIVILGEWLLHHVLEVDRDYTAG